MDLSRFKDFLGRRRSAYVATFDSHHGRLVLADLATFCRATTSTFHADPRVHAVAEGRREVWLRIARHLNLSDEQLFELFSGGKNAAS
jgi:hypothetical protein